MAKQKRDVLAEITEQFIAALETVGSDWKCPWRKLGTIPTNVQTGKQYSGVNLLVLMMQGGGVWGTYKQWQTAGAQVRAGEKGTLIVRPLMGKDKETEETVIFGWGGATVFGAHQVEGYTPKALEDAEAVPTVERVEAFIRDTGAEVRHGGDRAFYTPGQDYIVVPTLEQFPTTEDYYGTVLHELVHWSGGKRRLDRGLDTNRFGDEAYAFEELVAEIGAAFLCNHFGIHAGFREDHAKYIKNWLKTLKNDKKAVMTAASKASAAMKYLLDLADGVETAEAA